MITPNWVTPSSRPLTLTVAFTLGPHGGICNGSDVTTMTRLFISHSSEDDAFVDALQQALRDLNQDVWIDSRHLRGGDPLWPDIKRAIDESSAFAIVVSPDALQSKWVGKELRHALDVQKQRGKDAFRVTPILLN